MPSRDNGWVKSAIVLVALSCGGAVDGVVSSGDGRGEGGNSTQGDNPNATGGLGARGHTAQGGLSAGGASSTTVEEVVMYSSGGASTYSLPTCGNSRIDPGEECDDGATPGWSGGLGGDGCSGYCKIESGWNCPSPGKPCSPGPCGDGILGVYEICDDGNTNSGDGCLGDCSDVETGWSCPGAGLTCQPVCGDGIVTGPESCDDGNQDRSDGCSRHCTPIAAIACNDTDPGCATLTRCGDGTLDDDEECDDGDANSDETYGGCTRQCQLGPRCGDGIVNGPEACDQGQDDLATVGNYGRRGCTKGCREARYCGDNNRDLAFREECDWGTSNTEFPGRYSECTSHCVFGNYIGP